MKSLKKSLKNTNRNTQENYPNEAVWPGEAPPPYGPEGEKRYKEYMERVKKFGVWLDLMTKAVKAEAKCKKMEGMIEVKFTAKEKDLLNRFDISYANSMSFEMAEGVIDIANHYEGLSDEEQYIVDSIIDKIIIHLDW